MIVHWSFVYSHILWIISLIYVLFPYKLMYSPLISLIIAALYTTFSQIYVYNYSIIKKLIILLIEYLMIIIVSYKSLELVPLFINNKNMSLLLRIKSVIDRLAPSIIFNIVLFTLYLLYLKINNTSFYDIYFVRLPEQLNDK